MITRRQFIEAASAIGLTASIAKDAIASPTGSVSKSANSAARYEAVLGGKLVYKDAKHYETLRLASIWNARKPRRYPLAIVMADNESDVIAAVKLAKARHWKVSVCSGGHSFTASFLRDDALLINLSRLAQLDVESDKRIATISPSITGNVLGAGLAKHGFMTPTAHGVAVGMGGFVLCGGHGWNSRVWGPGCANLRALDVVTADGELIHCDEKNNADYFWAARGAGPGFFGVAVRYYMAVHPRPTVMRTSIYTYAESDIADVLTWIRDNLEAFPKLMETAVVGKMAGNVPVLNIIGTALGYNDKEVASALSVHENCPYASKAISQKLHFEDSIPHMTEAADESNPAGVAQTVDGMWTNASSAELVPATLEYFTSHPTRRADAYWSCWGAIQQLDDMAYSIQGHVYMSLNVVYDDGRDEEYAEYVAKAFKKLEPLAVGSQMNDENMYGRPSARYLSPSSSAQLDRLRAKHDPEGRFSGFLKG